MSPLGEASVLFFTDCHNSDNPPLRRKDGYREEILAKQEYLIKEAKKSDIVIIGGDVFHQKKSFKISYFLVNRLMEIYREYGDVYIVPGNHDFDMSVEELQVNPLGVIAKLPNVKVLHNEHFLWLDRVNFFFYGLADYDKKDRLESCLKNWYLASKEYHFINIAVLHAAVSTKVYPYETLLFDSISSYADFFLLGHLHDWQKIGGKIVAPGALSRGSLRADNIERRVGYALVRINLDTGDVFMKGFQIPCRRVEDVFKIQEKVEDDLLEERVSKFLDFLNNFDVSVTGSDLDDIIVGVKQMKDLPEPVKVKAIEILKGLS